MNHFILEIGTEEIPAGYIDPALKALSSSLLAKLEEQRIAYESSQTYGTPRRLAIMVRGVAHRQTSITEEVLGPPEKIARADGGTLKVPALKFAEKLGLHPDKLFVKETDKGRYMAANLTQKGRPAKSVLADMLPGIILSLPFPKTMRWADLSIEFARPIQWIMCMLGKSVVRFTLGDIKSGRHSMGHRFMHPKRVQVSSPDAYIDHLKTAFVMAEIDQRKARIETEISRVATQINGSVLPDADLVDVVTHLVEYPAVCAGTFDDKFLSLPDEILITAMREHQKYFAVTDGRTLLPHFIVVNNTPADDMQLVAKGHERVLRARLEDAMFFYDNDKSVPLEENVEKLKGVLFQATLGSMYDKSMRIGRLARWIADEAGNDAAGGDVKEYAERAALLCKADLVSQVVVEFPKLQGVIGGIYAANQNEPDEVAAAVEEHYRPTYSGGPLPKTVTGAIVGIADKLDSICGCFSAGLIPSGASDPYALRRQSIGAVQIILGNKFDISLMRMIRESLALYESADEAARNETAIRVNRFFRDRIVNMLAEEGFERDVIAAVTGLSIDSITDVWKKVAALQDLKKAPDYEPLAVAFKRVVNIIKKSASKKDDVDAGQLALVEISARLFEKTCEADLLAAYEDVSRQVAEKLVSGDFDEGLKLIASLREPVDRFFDGVMVMAGDDAVRTNRLALLGRIAALFETMADFSRLTT